MPNNVLESRWNPSIVMGYASGEGGMSPELAYVLGVIATMLALVLIVAWLAAGQLTRRRSPDPPDPPDRYDLPFEHITFTARDGVSLGGWLTGEARRPRPTVIFCAGMNGSMDGDTHLVPAFDRAGFDVLQFDWRGHGISDGSRVTLGLREVNDLRGAIDFLQARGVDEVGLLGFSMGAVIALRVAAQDPRVCCVAADGPYILVNRIVQGGLRSRLGSSFRGLAWLIVRMAELRLGGVRLGVTSPLPAVALIAPRPVLFIQGADDPFVTPSEQVRLLEACGEPKALWQVPGAGHREAQLIEPDAYAARLVVFFREAMGT